METESTGTPQPWEIVRDFLREIEMPGTALQTHTKQSDEDVWASHTWGDMGKHAIAGALRDALKRAVPEINIP